MGIDSVGTLSNPSELSSAPPELSISDRPTGAQDTLLPA
eukprot:CAMPEP_0194435686 /NCGR_PEP_ID=MMETSP0176-20130528/90180_1 /TAXON_ID=216777 /ORGANISM="Proboscia alata, Strain PI-D3" /LENGTH=38 /DNA_ID= /DNA_START= /DNA_END= /DNA_ORIENTATION=